MFAKLSTVVAISMAAFVAAAPSARGIDNSCNTGPVQCCDSVQDSKSLAASEPGLFGLITALVGPITAQVGLTCSPISALAIAGNSCSSQPVCCENNSFNGVVALGCSPINVNV